MKAVVVYKHRINALEQAMRILHRLGIKAQIKNRKNLRKTLRADFILTIGGDGTVLAAAPYARAVPILGLNAYPKTSVGFFCAVKITDLEKKIKAILARRVKPIKLPLLEAKIDGKKIKRLALNEFLLTSSNPAGTSRYRIYFGKRQEEQKSSGVWICAGPGSTAASRSAGGRRLPIDSDKMQFLVREPYKSVMSRFKILRGILKRGQSFKSVSLMSEGALFADGKQPGFAWKDGQTAEISISKKKLLIYR